MTKAEKEAFVKRMAAARRRKANGRKKTTTSRSRKSNTGTRRKSTTSRSRKSNSGTRRKSTTSRSRTSNPPRRRRRANESKILGTTASQRKIALFSAAGVVSASLVATPVSNWIEDNLMTPMGIRPGWGQSLAYLVGGALTFITGLSASSNIFKSANGKAAGNAFALMVSAPMFIRSAENAGVFGRPSPVAALPPMPTQGTVEAAGRRRNPGLPQYTGAGLPTLRGGFGKSSGMRGSIVPGRLAGSMLGTIVAGRLPGRTGSSMRGSIVAGGLPGQGMRGVRGGYGWY